MIMKKNKQKKLQKDIEFKKVFQKGRWVSKKWVTIHYLNSDKKHNRWGIIVSKKIGNAVIRNHIKRKIREICRALDKVILDKRDLVIIARRGIDKVGYWELKKDIEEACYRAKLIRREALIENTKQNQLDN